jgi:nucleoside-diphosphate kinase
MFMQNNLVQKASKLNLFADIEKTFVMILPDGVSRGLVGKIISRFEAAGLIIDSLEVQKPLKYKFERHYNEHREKEYFNDLINLMLEGPVVCMILEGKNAVNLCKQIIGTTDPEKAEPGTIRKDLGISYLQNTVYSSDSLDRAREEIKYWFWC